MHGEEEIHGSNSYPRTKKVYRSQLWFGIATWPPDYPDCLDEIDESNWDYIYIETIQYAGILCNQQPAVGVQFEVPEETELGKVGHLFDLTSWANSQYPKPNYVEILARRLAHLGLTLRTDSKSDIGEALYPLEAKSAWDFVVKENLEIWKQQRDQFPPICLVDRKKPGIDSWEQLTGYLTAYLKELNYGKDPGEQDWVALYSYPNSD